MEKLSIELQALIVFFSQIAFLFLRTVNVKATASGKTFKAVWTSTMIGMLWLLGIAIGSKAVLNLEFLPILGHIAGGIIGTTWGMKQKEIVEFIKRLLKRWKK